MARKKYKPEENEPFCATGSSTMANAKLRQVEVLMSQGRPVAEAVRAIGVTQFTCYRWRREYGGLKTDQVNQRLRQAASDLTLEKLILREAAWGNF